MKLGVNDAVNPGTKKAGLELMEGEALKINPLPKAVLQTQSTKLRKHRRLLEETVSELNKTAVIIGVVGVMALLFIAMR